MKSKSPGRDTRRTLQVNNEIRNFEMQAALIEFGAAELFSMSGKDVADIRRSTGLSQSKFASTFRLSIKSLQKWERDERKPPPPIATLLHLIARNPSDACTTMRSVENKKRLMAPPVSLKRAKSG
jgi:DNA-binding transcriptional regulator YiaG